MPKGPKKSRPAPDHLQDDFWPSPLRHLAQPFVAENDEEVIIGEITGEPDPGLMGIRMLFTAVVPKAEADTVLKTRGGIRNGQLRNWRGELQGLVDLPKSQAIGGRRPPHADLP